MKVSTKEGSAFFSGCCIQADKIMSEFYSLPTVHSYSFGPPTNLKCQIFTITSLKDLNDQGPISFTHSASEICQHRPGSGEETRLPFLGTMSMQHESGKDQLIILDGNHNKLPCDTKCSRYAIGGNSLITYRDFVYLNTCSF